MRKWELTEVKSLKVTQPVNVRVETGTPFWVVEEPREEGGLGWGGQTSGAGSSLVVEVPTCAIQSYT